MDINSEHGPMLGLATTRELIEELRARAEVDKLWFVVDAANDLLIELAEDFLDYRTVDS